MSINLSIHLRSLTKKLGFYFLAYDELLMISSYLTISTYIGANVYWGDALQPRFGTKMSKRSNCNYCT